MASTFEESSFEKKLHSALAFDLPYSERSSSRVPGLGKEKSSLPSLKGTPSAVLALFAQTESGISLLLTQRSDTLENHKGQMAFPGGVRDASDVDNNFTALRETEEEVGIPREKVRVLGTLPDLWTPSGFWITPIVGYLKSGVEEVPLKINRTEVASAIWIPLSTLRDPKVYSCESREYRGVLFPIHVYQVGTYRIWGATGAMIKNLLDRLAGVID